MSRLNKNLQSKKKAYVHVHPVPENNRDPTLGNHQIHTLNPPLPPPLPFLVCFKCCVVTKHTGGKWFCVMASESVSPRIARMNHCCFSLDEGIDSNCSGCCDELEFPSLWHWTREPDWAGHHRADAGYSHGSVTFQGMQQTHQCSTRSYHFHQKVLADILAVCACVCMFCFM